MIKESPGIAQYIKVGRLTLCRSYTSKRIINTKRMFLEQFIQQQTEKNRYTFRPSILHHIPTLYI